MGTLLLSLTPSAAAQTSYEFSEGFESFTVGDTTPTSPDYTYSSQFASAFVSTAQAHTGTKSFKHDATGSGALSTFAIADQCGVEDDYELTFWVYLTAIPTSGDFFRFWLSADAGQPNSNAVVITIDALADVTLKVENSVNTDLSQTIATPMPATTWVDFRFGTGCTGATGGFFSGVLNDGTGVDVTGSITELDNFNIQDSDTATDPAHFYVDDFQWADNVAASQSGDRFCANPGEDNFGYDYVEGVSFIDDISQIGISLEDAFLFSGTSGTSEYLAKGYDPGSEAFLVRVRLEADVDTTASKFRIAFTTGATVLTEGSGADLTTDLAAASDGEDGGNFDDHVQIIFIENSNSWGLSAWYNVGGAGLTQIAGALNYGANPNSPTTFQVVVNSGTTDLPTSVDGHTIPDIGDNVISVQDGDGNIIFQWQLPAGLFNAEWKDQWFIGKGTSAATAETFVDDTDQSQDDDSTCLWDLLGTGTRTGSAGLAPGSTIIDPPDEPGGGFSSLFDPDNIDSQLFIGFLLVAGVIFTGVRQGVLGIGLMAFFMLGMGLAYALGWMPMWIILVMFVIALAAVWFLPKPSGDGV